MRWEYLKEMKEFGGKHAVIFYYKTISMYKTGRFNPH